MYNTSMRKRILLVEDEHIIALQTVKLLNENGFQVHIAGSAHAAIEAVKNQPVDLILMDIELEIGRASCRERVCVGV